MSQNTNRDSLTSLEMPTFEGGVWWHSSLSCFPMEAKVLVQLSFVLGHICNMKTTTFGWKRHGSYYLNWITLSVCTIWHCILFVKVYQSIELVYKMMENSNLVGVSQDLPKQSSRLSKESSESQNGLNSTTYEILLSLCVCLSERLLEWSQVHHWCVWSSFPWSSICMKWMVLKAVKSLCEVYWS